MNKLERTIVICTVQLWLYTTILSY